MSKITIRISPETAAEIHALAERHGYTAKDLILWGISLARLALEEHEKGNSLILMNGTGKPLSKIVLPQIPSWLLEDTLRQITREPNSLSLEQAIADLDPDPRRIDKNQEAANHPPPDLWAKPSP